MKLIYALCVIATLAALLALPASGITSGPPAPTNLEVVAVADTSVTLAWGPSQPGEFYEVSEQGSTVTIAWGASQDSRGSVTYSLSKNGTTVASGLTATNSKLGGITGKTKTFRTCVTASLADGRTSPPMCATWNRG